MTDATEQRTVAKAADAAAEFSASPLEPIPGYELEEKIGSGGYGEVWRARAPGGLQKAVKLVYGTMDESRATAEMKAMERIKGVRHPFILSTERIEISEGRLIIVSELADKSLRDYFNECKVGDSVGIERDELLRFMRDVADALDHLHTKHSLQHLDIKPENLLLVGDHVKVADFGLMKNLADASMSIVSGLTPQYSAPEVLEGKPGRHSDQYSLAIVYQYLQTGLQPFRGRTAAQLLSQHLHSAPDLSPLPPQDQSIVAKALSKNAKRRYESCREFIEALTNVKERFTSATRKSSRARQAEEEEDAATPDERPVDPADIVLKPRPPIKLDDANRVARPTLVIGVGGLGGKVLRQLRGALMTDLDDRMKPLVGICYLDTDELIVGESLYDADMPNLKRDEVLAIPLRQSSAYRRRFKQLVEWISRRWLFNIPRSLNTEGIRALGRLAFVDHYREIHDHLTRSLEFVTSDEHIERIEIESGMKCDRQSPRVFIVGSTSGGAAGGSMLDLAYLVRHVLGELELSDAGLCGVFLHGTPHGDAKRTMCAGNNLAFIRELHHFLRTKQYPGNDAAEIPDQDFTPPFADSYVVPIGDDLRSAGYATATRDVAEYLLRSVDGEAAFAFDHLRQSTSGRQRKPVAVRSFAVRREDDSKEDTKQLVEDVQSRLLATRGGTRWIHAGSKSKAPILTDLQIAVGKESTHIPDKSNAEFLCCEVEAVPLCDIETVLEDAEPDSIEIAERMHSRIDIEWR